MRAAAVRSFVDEARRADRLVRDQSTPRGVHSICVSGVLADQLAKELGAGAAPGAVRVALGPPADVDVLVRVVAGEPSPEDEAVVREADRRGIEVVVVQLWPQAEWTEPFVLTPFVVECRAGEGFPVREIADRIVEASDEASLLGADVPVLRESVERAVVRRTIVHSVVLGALTARRARPLITFGQMQMALRLEALARPGSSFEGDPANRLRAATAGVFASGLAFQGLARFARRVLPDTLANAVVAGAGTWAVARAAKALAARRAA